MPKYYVPITVIVEVKDGYIDDQEMKQINRALRAEIRCFLDEVDTPSDAVQEILAGEAELVHLNVEEPIGL